MQEQIYTLTEELSFPNPSNALDEPNGLLAQGGDLSTDRLLLAYSMGIFPWYCEGEPILWWSPNPRAVLYLEDFKVNRSLKKTLNKGEYKVQIDTNFSEVINACQKRNPLRESEETWITRIMKDAYLQLHKMGYAHSVSCFKGDKFVGGLYGVSLGNLFFGESMISLETDASKVALHYLVSKLSTWGFKFIDCQVPSEHMISLGAKLISREKFLNQVKNNNKLQKINENWTKL
jgi:leucyl/phenylalanyl-tRNA--protein transferase